MRSSLSGGASLEPSSGADVSVLVPCWNCERYIGEAIESILTQSYAPSEVVVIDDGSTDASLAVVGRFGSRVQAYQQPNSGISAARNAAVAKARGDWIAFLDADDLWPRHSLAERAAVLAADESIGLVAGLVEQFVSPDLSVEDQSRFAVPEGPMQGRVAGTLLVRREVFDRVGGFDPAIRVGETLDWISRVDAAGVRSAQIDNVVLRRRVHAANTTRERETLTTNYLRVLRAAIARRREEAVVGG